MSTLTLAATAGLSAISTYAVMLGIFKVFLPWKLRRENHERKLAHIGEAKTRARAVKDEAHRRDQSRLQSAIEELDDQISMRKENLDQVESELASQEEFANHSETQLQKELGEIENQRRKVQSLQDKLNHSRSEMDGIRVELVQKLEEYSQSNCENMKKQLAEDFVEKRTLEFQRVLKNLEEDISTNARKLASRMLYRLESRYAPQFYWPKAINHVEISDPRLLEKLSGEGNPILSQLRELSEDVTIELNEPQENPNATPSIKLVGGFGLYKEAARLSMEELIKAQLRNTDKLGSIFQKNVQILQSQALDLGRRAVQELQLDNVHEEIQKMVGYLNWRTSYRQNQYLHTLEVAKLAGLLGHEMGIDPDIAKRCGLMHDIGKTLDYKIEGSHAVISGDYADRYGESRIVCDTCMSHHNDLVLETPMSYVLKTADTLSGARPGARVNLEEGYQIRLSAIDEAVRSFKGVSKVAIMNGGREVHIEVNHKKISENELHSLTESIARKIEVDVAFPGQIKVLVSRRFEASAVA